jgi:hypothetical protein
MILRLTGREEQCGFRHPRSGKAQIMFEAAGMKILDTQRNPEFDSDHHRYASQPRRFDGLAPPQRHGLRHHLRR